MAIRAFPQWQFPTAGRTGLDYGKRKQNPAPYRSELAIGQTERAAIFRGDLRGFWLSRLARKDVVSRVGLALWGTEEDLRCSNDANPDFWKPDLDMDAWLSLRTRWQLDRELRALFPECPDAIESSDERVKYWSWVGHTTDQRVRRYLHDEGTEVTEALVKEIGIAIANAHCEAVSADIRDRRGEIPGQLGLRQIARYHHEVFASFGLPPKTYGGTPYGFLPDFLELLFAGDLYATGADSG